MPRRTDDILVSVAMSDQELAVLAEMRRSGSVDSDANLIRIALWSLADHLDLDVPLGVFDLRNHGGSLAQRPNGPRTTPKTRPNPHISQHQPPAKNHPWRQYRRPA